MAGCIKKNDGLDFIKKTFHSSPSRMYGGLCFHGNQFGGPNVCVIFHVQLGPPSARFLPITKCKEDSPQPLVICTSIRLTHLFSSWTSLFSKVEVCVTKKKRRKLWDTEKEITLTIEFCTKKCHIHQDNKNWSPTFCFLQEKVCTLTCSILEKVRSQFVVKKKSNNFSVVTQFDSFFFSHSTVDCTH